MSFTGKSHEYLSITIANDGFFPDISLGDFQVTYRAPAEYKTEVVAHHIKRAIYFVNGELECASDEWKASGIQNLNAVYASDDFKKSELIEQYKAAVYCRAMGYLVRAFATLNRKAEAENLAKESPDVVSDYFAQSLHAIRRITGIKNSITAVLL